VSAWVWRAADDLPTPSNQTKEAVGRHAYETALAAHKPDEALGALSVTFPRVAQFLDPPAAHRTPPVVESHRDSSRQPGKVVFGRRSEA
jgi:hypothetical protein